MSRLAVSSIAIALLSAPLFCLAADAPQEKSKPEPKLIKPDEAKDCEGKEVVVEFTVEVSRELADKGVCFLNSTSDPKDPNGFTAFITVKGLKLIKTEAKIDKPADHFKKKKIRVAGPIKKYNDKFEIEVNSPDQIKIVEDEKKEEKK